MLLVDFSFGGIEPAVEGQEMFQHEKTNAKEEHVPVERHPSWVQVFIAALSEYQESISHGASQRSVVDGN